MRLPDLPWRAELTGGLARGATRRPTGAPVLISMLPPPVIGQVKARPPDTRRPPVQCGTAGGRCIQRLAGEARRCPVDEQSCAGAEQAEGSHETTHWFGVFGQVAFEFRHGHGAGGAITLPVQCGTWRPARCVSRRCVWTGQARSPRDRGWRRRPASSTECSGVFWLPWSTAKPRIHHDDRLATVSAGRLVRLPCCRVATGTAPQGRLLGGPPVAA